MSVIASRPESAAVPYSTMPHQSRMVQNYKDSAYSVPVQPQPISTRTPSVSSFKSNYTVSTSPTIYSPTSPCVSYFLFDSAQPPPSPKPAESIFKRLPQEVYDGIANQLEILHTAPNQTGCMTCFQRDLHALSLTSRAWEKGVRSKL